MRETRADTVQATLLAIALHVLLFVLAWIGMWWTRTNAPQSAVGPVIEAELIDPDALSASMQRVLSERPEPLQAVEPVAEPVPEPKPEPPEPKPEPIESMPPPQPLPEPVPEESPTPPQPQPQERVPEPDKREQERVSKQALAAEEAKKREQEERRRQEQIELEAEQKRQAEAERKQRLTEMEQQRRQQLADIRRRRAEAAQEAEQAAQKLARIKAAQQAAAEPAPASASPPPGNEGVDPALLARYIAAISADIESNWTKPDNIQPGQRCRITIRQLPGGEVIDAKVAPDCPYDELSRRSIETAVLKAQPLPYAGFEDVFNRILLLNFEPAR